MLLALGSGRVIGFMVLTVTKRMSALVPMAFGRVAELFVPLSPVALFGLVLAMLGVIAFVSTV